MFFTVLRSSPEKDQHVLTMTNVTNRVCRVEISLSDLKINEENRFDLLAGKEWLAEGEKLMPSFKPQPIYNRELR